MCTRKCNKCGEVIQLINRKTGIVCVCCTAQTPLPCSACLDKEFNEEWAKILKKREEQKKTLAKL